MTGVGFLGGGLIFVRRDVVRGLTTASSVWLAAAIGMAAGSGLLLLALSVTATHYAVVFLLPQIGRVVPQSQYFSTAGRIDYPDRQGALRTIMEELTGTGWNLTNFGIRRDTPGVGMGQVAVSLEISGRGSRQELLSRLEALGSVINIDLDNEDTA